MKNIIKAILKRLGYKISEIALIEDNSLKISSSLNVHKSSCIEGLKVVERHKNPNSTKLVVIGKDSVVKGDFIFELPQGRIEIGERSFIGGGMFISIDEISVGNDVMISWGCTFSDNNSHSTKWSERANDVLDWKKGLEENKLGFHKDWSKVKHSPIIIKDKVWIGFNSIILKGVTIGEGAIVGAGSVVTKDVPDWTIVAGNPAKIIRIIPEDER